MTWRENFLNCYFNPFFFGKWRRENLQANQEVEDEEGKRNGKGVRFCVSGGGGSLPLFHSLYLSYLSSLPAPLCYGCYGDGKGMESGN